MVAWNETIQRFQQDDLWEQTSGILNTTKIVPTAEVKTAHGEEYRHVLDIENREP